MNQVFYFVGLELTLEIAPTFLLLSAALISVTITRFKYTWAVFLMLAYILGLYSGLTEIVSLPFILYLAFAPS